MTNPPLINRVVKNRRSVGAPWILQRGWWDDSPTINSIVTGQCPRRRRHFVVDHEEYFLRRVHADKAKTLLDNVKP